MKNEGETPEPLGGWPSEIKNWIHDNVRIVLSIIIVLVIALGVYSYSKRGAEETEEKLAEEATEEVNIEEIITGETTEMEEEGEMETEPAETEEISQEAATAEEAVEEPEEMQAEEIAEEAVEEEIATVVSQTDGSYEVTAAGGDSLTTLARSAVKQYLDAHNDSSITAEHKIYMEDYLAKKMGYSSQLNIGETKTFSESDIELALKDAKTLTSDQLENLKVFSQQVPGL